MSAIISQCGKYRYRLEREAGLFDSQATAVIMVNPSTADAELDDATIRRLKGFGSIHNWGKIVVGNLFAYRATDVRELGSAIDPIGPDNDQSLCNILSDVDRVIVAWGPLGKQPKALRGRYKEVYAMIKSSGFEPMCIGQPAKDGQPKHPLMLSYSEPIIAWIAP